MLPTGTFLLQHNSAVKFNELREVFRQKRESSGENITEPELYNDIEHLLGEEEEKCELLDQYRHMLLMG
jgi:hypothetical protein